MIAARHAEIAENELREKGQVKANEQGDRSGLGQPLGIQPAGDLGPPEVQSTDVPHHRTADHDVVKVRDDEVSVVQVNVETKARQEQAGQTAGQKKPYKPEPIKHRLFRRNRTFV